MQDNELRKLGKTDLLTIIYEQEKKINQLSEEVEELEKKLEDKTIKIEEAGSIAEASLKLNKIFETAQQAADEYLKSIKEVNSQEKSQEEAKAKNVANDESIENTNKEKNDEEKIEKIDTKDNKELILINNEFMVIKPKLLKRILIFLLALKEKFKACKLKIKYKKIRFQLKRKSNLISAKIKVRNVKIKLKNALKKIAETVKYRFKGNWILIKRFFAAIKKAITENKHKLLNENNEIANREANIKNEAKEKAKKEKAIKKDEKEKEKLKKVQIKEEEKQKRIKEQEEKAKLKEEEKQKRLKEKEEQNNLKAVEKEKALEEKKLKKEQKRLEEQNNLKAVEKENKTKLTAKERLNRLKRIFNIRAKKIFKKTKKIFQNIKEKIILIKKNGIKSEIKLNIEKKENKKKLKISKQEEKLKEMKLSMEEIEAELERQKKNESRAIFIRTFAFSAVVIIAIAIIISTSFFKILQISGNSMEPNLYENELVLTSKFFGYEKGDMIAFYYNDTVLIKRVIALEGDIVSMDEDGTVYVNSVKLEEDYVKELDYGNCDITFPYQVPKDGVFVLGDNRAVSLDSRSKLIGSISEDKIIGKIELKLFPFVIY